MKIVTVTMVKNEENIIESFVRHAFRFSDHVVVFNHESTDGTKEILEKLQDEFKEKFTIYPKVMTTVMTINQEMFNHMIAYAFEKLGADMVLPLDADEFPILLEKGNIRTYMEGLDLNYCYKVHFMPFAIAENWKKDVFAPTLFRRHKKISVENDYKIFLTRSLYYDYGIEVGLGNHVFWGKRPVPDDLLKDLYPQLCYAHFAFRNREHLENKLVIRWLSLLMRDDLLPGAAFQYQSGYHKILKGQNLSQKEMDWFSMNNMCSGADNIETEELIQTLVEETEASNLFDDIKLKYVDYIQEKSNYVLLMEFTEQVIAQYKKEKELKEKSFLKNTEQAVLLEEMKKNYATLEADCQNMKNQIDELQRKYMEVNDNLVNIRGSKAWKLIQTYRKIVGKHDPTQD